MNLKEIQSLVYQEYIKNGYLDMWTFDTNPNTYSKIQRIFDLAEIGLWNTETAETQEDTRKHGYPLLLEKWGEECADVIIRVLNFASRKGIDVESEILNKHQKNLERGKNHGKEI